MKSGVGLRLQHAGKRFNRDWIFRELALDIVSGQQIALTGPNGSGKSTLLGVISGYQSLSEGEISWEQDGLSIDRDSLYNQLVLTAPYLDLPEHLTAAELFDFHFKIKGNRFKGGYSELIESANLKQITHKIIRDYSSGMKQRLKLLLVFYSDVPLLLLDEPTANLDQSGIDWYMDLKEKETDGRTLVIASNQSYEYAGCHQLIDINTFKV
jgi:ABC-type multidrug transport system ATPase subunit